MKEIRGETVYDFGTPTLPPLLGYEFRIQCSNRAESIHDLPQLQLGFELFVSGAVSSPEGADSRLEAKFLHLIYV